MESIWRQVEENKEEEGVRFEKGQRYFVEVVVCGREVNGSGQWKMAAHEGAFMSLFTRQSEGQTDSEDTQQQFSRAHPRSIKAFLLPFYL